MPARRAVLWVALALNSVAFLWVVGSWEAEYGWDPWLFFVMSPGVAVPALALVVSRWSLGAVLVATFGLALLVFSAVTFIFGGFLYALGAALLMASPAIRPHRVAPRHFGPGLLVVSAVFCSLIVASLLRECLPSEWELVVILPRGATTSETEDLGRSLTGTDVWAGEARGRYFFVINDLPRDRADTLRRRFERASGVQRVVQQRDERCAGVDPGDSV